MYARPGGSETSPFSTSTTIDDAAAEEKEEDVRPTFLHFTRTTAETMANEERWSRNGGAQSEGKGGRAIDK